MTHDITQGMTGIINLIYNGMETIITQMRSIEFFGTNLFTFITVLTILGIAIPILLVVPSKIVSKSERIISKK